MSDEERAGYIEEQMEEEAEKALLDEWYRTGENPYVCR